MYALFVFALTLCSFITVVTGIEVSPCPGEKDIENSECYTCPQFSSLPTKKLANLITLVSEDVGQICYAVGPSDSFRCQYESTVFHDKDNNKYLPPNPLGRCKYHHDGRKGDGSMGACPDWAPQDHRCFKVKEQADDAKNYFKKCTEKGCNSVVTETCFTCPVRRGAESVVVDTRTGVLRCGYQVNGKLGFTCDYYNGKESGDVHHPKCDRTADTAILCKESRDRRIEDEKDRAQQKAAAAAEAAKKKAKADDALKYDNSKSALAYICEGIVAQSFSNAPLKSYWLNDRKVQVQICREPDKALDKLDVNYGNDDLSNLAIADYITANKIKTALIAAGFKRSS